MKRVFSSQVRPTAERIRELLEEQGIGCFVTGYEYVGVAFGEIPANESWPGVWVYQDCDEDRALHCIEEFQRRKKRANGVWVCADCGEESEGQFDACWKCGAPKST